MNTYRWRRIAKRTKIFVLRHVFHSTSMNICRIKIAALPTYFAPVRATRPISPRTTRPPAVHGTRPHPQTTPMSCPARARTSLHTTRRTQHAPIPANRLNAVPARARTPMSCPTRTRASMRTARRAQHAPTTAHHALLRCPARQYSRGSFPETLHL